MKTTMKICELLMTNKKEYISTYETKFMPKWWLSYFEENKGSNRDNSKNDEYCTNCYQNGEFLDHSLTLHGLQVKLMEMAAFHNEINLGEVEQIIMNLPRLKGW